MLFWNRWNHESAGRVYFNISREKTRSHARHAALSTALVQTWMDQSGTLLLFFAETNQRQSCSMGSPELLISPLHAQKSSGSRLIWNRSRHGNQTYADVIVSCFKIVIGFYQVISGIFTALAKVKWPVRLIPMEKFLKVVEGNIFQFAPLSCISIFNCDKMLFFIFRKTSIQA